MMMGVRPSAAIIIPLILAIAADAFSSSSSSSYGASGGIGPISLDRFRATCPADLDAVRRFDPSLLDNGGGRKTDDDDDDDDDDDEDVWVAVYRSANNLPNVFVRDAFFDAMRASTASSGGVAILGGDSETLVSTPPSSSSVGGGGGAGVMMISNGSDDGETPVAVARLGKESHYIIDSMRCALRKEETDPDCDGGSEHAEAIGVCIDELVLAYLRGHSEMTEKKVRMSFDGGMHFRGTLVSGKLLDSRGFREVDELSADMHSHESDYDGALDRYSERSTSVDVSRYPGARDRALRIVSYLGRMDREEDEKRRGGGRGGAAGGGERGGDAEAGDDDGGGESDFDPWASVKSKWHRG
jgi:hypothetical protein